MGKVSHHTIGPREREKMLGHIAHALGSLKQEKDIQSFLQQLLTSSEIIMLSRRLKVARLLIEGNTYREIREQLNVGISTIIAIDKWLEKAIRNYPTRRQAAAKNVRSSAKGEKNKRTSTKVSALPRGKYGIEYVLLNLFLG